MLRSVVRSLGSPFALRESDCSCQSLSKCSTLPCSLIVHADETVAVLLHLLGQHHGVLQERLHFFSINCDLRYLQAELSLPVLSAGKA